MILPGQRCRDSGRNIKLSNAPLLNRVRPRALLLCGNERRVWRPRLRRWRLQRRWFLGRRTGFRRCRVRLAVFLGRACGGAVGITGEAQTTCMYLYHKGVRSYRLLFGTPYRMYVGEIRPPIDFHQDKQDKQARLPPQRTFRLLRGSFLRRPSSLLSTPRVGACSSSPRKPAPHSTPRL